MGWASGPKINTDKEAEARRYAAELQHAATVRGQNLLQEQYEQMWGRYGRDEEGNLVMEREGLYTPWIQAGQDALAEYQEKLDSGYFVMDSWKPPSITAFVENPEAYDPGFAFTQREGEKHLRRRGSLSGSAQSGATMKALESWRSDLARTRYDEARGRSLQDYNIEQNRRNLQAQYLGGMMSVGGAKLDLGASYGQANAAQQAGLGIQGANALGQGEIGAAQAQIQGQIYAYQRSQDKFNNIMRVIGW